MKTTRKTLLTGLFAVLLLMNACSPETRDKYEDAAESTEQDIRKTARSVGDKAGQTGEQVADKTKEVAREVGSSLNQSKVDFVAAMRRENRQLEKRIEELKDQLDRKGKQAGAGLREEIAGLETKRKDLNDKVKDVENASGDAWQQLKKGVQDAVADLRRATNQAEDELEEEKKK